MSQLPIFAQRTLLVAFEGWSDAAEAATTTLKMIADEMSAEPVVSIDPEEYAEFHYARPHVYFDDNGDRQIRWPSTELLTPGLDAVVARPELGNIFLLLGIEPALRWRAFVAEILEIIDDRDIQAVVFVGAMISDVPHTRPIKVMKFSQHEGVRHELEVEKSDYEGPVGILTVLSQALEELNLPTVNLWAQIPAYVHQAPSPKAVLALLTEVEQILGFEFDHANLANDAFEWERGIDELAESDEDMASYIEQLEKSRDELQQSEGSGEILASEFEKFLRQSGEIIDRDATGSDSEGKPDSNSGEGEAKD